jgi:hypothetical protein
VALDKRNKFNAMDELKAAPTSRVAIPGHADAPESTPLHNWLNRAFPGGATPAIL